MNIDGVILAAGLSTRAGVFKMELMLGNKALIQRTIESMYGFCSRIIVVGGNRYERICELTCGYSKVKVVYNEKYQEGMFASVQEGLKHIQSEWFFFTPGDYPFISHEVYEKLLNASLHCKDEIFVPVYKGKKGHPILINASLKDIILKKTVDYSLREIINSKGYTAVEIDQKEILFDIDTKEDYQRALEEYGAGGKIE